MMELKPCPLCGHKNPMLKTASDSAGSLGNWVECRGCGMNVGYLKIWTDVDSGIYQTEDEAALTWNTRPIEDALAAKAAESARVCKEALKNLSETVVENIDLIDDLAKAQGVGPVDLSDIVRTWPGDANDGFEDDLRLAKGEVEALRKRVAELESQLADRNENNMPA